MKVIDTQSSPLTRRHILRNSCHCFLTKLTVALLNLSHLATIVLRCKVWAGTYWQLCDLPVWKLCFLFSLGNFNRMAPVMKYMDFPRANTFAVHCGCAMATKRTARTTKKEIIFSAFYMFITTYASFCR